jgi:hypothetical protein
VKSFIACVVLGAFALAVAGCGGTNVQNTGAKSTATERKVSSPGEVKLFYGPKDAKVQITAYFPLNEKHLKIIEFLNGLADKYPGKVNVTAWNWSTSEGADETKKVMGGKICGGMFINEKSDFKAVVDGKMKDISIMDGEWATWTKPEVAAALDLVVKQTYGEAAAAKSAPVAKSETPAKSKK